MGGAPKVTISKVFKQDLKVFVYLLVFGGVAFLSAEYLVNPKLALVFGAAADYIVYRVKTELKNEGYREALNGK